MAEGDWKPNETFKFSAQVESYFDRKDYQRNGRCVRFSAVSTSDFEKLNGDEGVTTYTIDLSYWHFCYVVLGNRWLTTSVLKSFEDGLLSGEKSAWYSLEIRFDEKPAHGYAYPTFSTDEPRYFSLLKCTAISAPSPPSVSLASKFVGSASPLFKSKKSFGSGSPWTLWTFHVGQGMCSLLTDDKECGILFDAGAGTPIRRRDYIYGSRQASPNDLLALLKKLSHVELILSHGDLDHWRLLAWDARLRNLITVIHVPDNCTKSAALNDKAIIGKVAKCSGLKYHLKGGGNLDVFRSSPKIKNDNTECLVALYSDVNRNHCVLMAGDYVYEGMNSDANLSINTLRHNHYSGIVVPHHGDLASAKAVFRSRFPNVSIAFFSAGDHEKYNHPTPASWDAHKLANFNAIKGKDIRYITKVKIAG